MKFLKLTEQLHGERLFVAVKRIETIESITTPSDPTQYSITRVTMTSGAVFEVNEDAEEISTRLGVLTMGRVGK